MTKVSDEQRKDILKAWKKGRSTGQSQQDFCKTHDISSRTLRAWVSAEGVPKVSVVQAEGLLRKMGRHLLEVAEALASGTGDGDVCKGSDGCVPEAIESIGHQPIPLEPTELNAETPAEPAKREKIQWSFD